MSHTPSLRGAACEAIGHAKAAGLIHHWSEWRGLYELHYRSGPMDVAFLAPSQVGPWLASQVGLRPHDAPITPAWLRLLDAMERLAEHLPWWEVAS
jgi:hypothetical protein